MQMENAEPSAQRASWLETIYAPLWRVFRIDRSGVIDGVTLDLRHPSLDPWEWQIETLWTDPEFGWQQGPKLWFPWFGPLDEVNRCAHALHWAETSAHSFEEWAARLLPVAEVTAGCTINVAEVDVRLIDGRDFDHEHDAEIRYAYLQLVYPDGRGERLEQPLKFRGATSFEHDPYLNGVTLDKVIARICGLLGVRSVYSYNLVHGSFDKTELAFTEASSLSDHLARWQNNLPEEWEDDPLLPSRQALMALVDSAVSLGFRYAQAEAEQRVLPYATAGLASAQGAALAGYKSGEVRRRKAESTWHPQALELARLSRARNPSNSQDAVVADIQAGWKTEVPACPGTKTLKSFVSTKESTGELPRRDQWFRVANPVHVAS